MIDYLTELGFTYCEAPAGVQYERPGPWVECIHCHALTRREGDFMRSHRRRCPVAPADPYTPAVCDA